MVLESMVRRMDLAAGVGLLDESIRLRLLEPAACLRLLSNALLRIPAVWVHSRCAEIQSFRTESPTWSAGEHRQQDVRREWPRLLATRSGPWQYDAAAAVIFGETIRRRRRLPRRIRRTQVTGKLRRMPHNTVSRTAACSIAPRPARSRSTWRGTASSSPSKRAKTQFRVEAFNVTYRLHSRS